MKIILKNKTNIAIDRVGSKWDNFVELTFDNGLYNGYHPTIGIVTLELLENNFLKLFFTISGGITEVRGSISGYRLDKNPWDKHRSDRDFYFKNEHLNNSGLQKLFESKKDIKIIFQSTN